MMKGKSDIQDCGESFHTTLLRFVEKTFCMEHIITVCTILIYDNDS